jgi:serine/threonine protein kinase
MADERLTPSPGTSDKEASSDLSSGFLVGGGRFNLLRELGRGGMGVVWLAHDERLMAPVALKFLSQKVRSNPVALSDLRQETKKSRMLSHPNILRIYDLYEAPEEEAFISMEYVEGPSLWVLRSRQPNGCFSWEWLKPIVKQLCAALDYAHGEDVIHRDLKSANMLLDERQRLRLADFGIAARALASPTNNTGVRLTTGTISYMSPQQIEGAVPCVADDIYALGATLYELLSGRPPFYENDIAYQVRNVLATPLSERLADLELDNDVPPAVAAMIMACLSKEPGKRPPSARAVEAWIGLTDATPTLMTGFAPTVVPPPTAATHEAPRTAPPTVPPPPDRESAGTAAPPPARNDTVGRFLGMLAGTVGVGVAAWLAWTHFTPNLPVVSAPGSTTNTNVVEMYGSNATKPAPVISALSLKGTSVSIEMGATNSEKGLREVIGQQDGMTAPNMIAGKECRLLASGARSRCYFEISAAGKSTNLMNARIEVEYYANAPGVLQLQFDGVASKQTPHYTGGGKVNFSGEQGWQTANFHVKRARFGNGERGGADFRLTTSSPELYIHRVTLFFDE